MINKILVPVDGSKIALRALEFAMEIGGKFGSEIIVINIDVPYDLSRIKPPRRDKNGNVIPVEAAAPTPLEEAEKEARRQGMNGSPSRKWWTSIRQNGSVPKRKRTIRI